MDESYHASKCAIEEGEAEIAQLMGRITTIRATLQQHRANVAPIRLVPGEILLMVFRLLRPCTCICDETVFRVTAVCRRWRELAISCPQLWVEVIFDLKNLVRGDQPHEVNEDGERIIELASEEHVLSLQKRVDLQLQRSLPCTLDVTLLIGDLDDLNDEQSLWASGPGGLPVEFMVPIQRAIENIIHNAHRCHRLLVGGVIPETWDSYPPNRPTFSSLESLHLRSDWHWVEQEDFITNTNTPLLRHLQLSDLVLWSSFSDTFNWGNIDTLVLQQCEAEPRSLFALLRRAAASITSLEIDDLYPGLVPYPALPQDEVAVLLPKLQMVNVSYSGPRPSSRLLDEVLPHLSAPVLTHLILRGNVNEYSMRSMCSLARFLDNSGSNAKVSKLHFEMDAYHVNLLPLFELAAVIDLTICWIDKGHNSNIDNTLKKLTWPPNDSKRPSAYRFFPNLTRLTLRRFGAMTPRVLEDMVRSRARGAVGECRKGSPAILERFVLEDTRFPDPQPDLTWLMDMEKQGLINV